MGFTGKLVAKSPHNQSKLEQLNILIMKLQYKFKEKTDLSGRVLPNEEVNIRIATYIKDYDGSRKADFSNYGSICSPY